MKVIFIKDLRGQGKKNDIKEVSDGYATNFLIKNGYAVKYTKTSVNILDEQIKERELKEKEDIKIASEIKDKIEKETIKFNVKVGKDSKVFGSISTKQIAEELKKIGYNIDKKNIKIDIPLTSLGTHIVKINLHKKVDANLKVVLIEK